MLALHLASLRVALAIIPRHVIQTCAHPGEVPAAVGAAWQRFAPGWQRRVFDDDECLKALGSHGPRHQSAFHALNGAHRGDLCRYALLYSHGGVYADIKFVPKSHLDDVVAMTHGAALATVIADPAYTPFALHQGFIIAARRHPLFARLMRHVVDTVERNKPFEYQVFTREMFTQVQRAIRGEVKPGLHPSFSGGVFLFQESCATTTMAYYMWGHEPRVRVGNATIAGIDRYCNACVIHAGNTLVAKVRYDDYPWVTPRPRRSCETVKTVFTTAKVATFCVVVYAVLRCAA